MIHSLSKNEIGLSKEEHGHPQASRQYKSRYMLLIFDSGTRLGELRRSGSCPFLGKGFQIKQRLVKVEV